MLGVIDQSPSIMAHFAQTVMEPEVVRLRSGPATQPAFIAPNLYLALEHDKAAPVHV